MKTMKKRLSERLLKFHLLFSIAVGFLLSSCMEYTSHYPIGKPKETTIKSNLLGDWTYVSGYDRLAKKELGYGGHFMRVSPFNEKEYLVQLIADTIASAKDIDQFRGYTTNISKQDFANISPIDNKGERPVYSIYKYELDGDSLLVLGISEDIFDSLNISINSTGQHKKFIKLSLEKPIWWNREYKYVKKDR